MQKKRTHRSFGTTPDGQSVTEFTLANSNGLEMKVINYGCAITSLKVPDRNGLMGNIVLGFDQLDGYVSTNQHIGCIAGRYANRIAFGKFILDENEYFLAANNGPHHLHGGIIGFNRAVWVGEEIQYENGVGVVFRHFSPDRDEGYPGNLHVEVKYILSNDNTLTFEYSAVTDQQTIINLTQHSYFNLNGGKEDILDHQLTVYADYFLPVNERMIPTGEIRSVANTPFDFRNAKKVRQDITEDDPQLIIGHGYDHTWILRQEGDDLQHAATLYDDESGRVLEVFTTEPGVQLYTANFLEGAALLENNIALRPRLGVCLETQHYPDSPNHAEFPTTKLKPGEGFYSKTLLKFSFDTDSPDFEKK
jgi:aldose 1-epimerase